MTTDGGWLDTDDVQVRVKGNGEVRRFASPQVAFDWVEAKAEAGTLTAQSQVSGDSPGRSWVWRDAGGVVRFVAYRRSGAI